MALRQRVEALKAPEPDGQAAVCKTAEAGSTPAGASQRLPRRSPLVVHPHEPYRARGRRRRSPRTPGTHTPVNQTMPDTRRSDTPPRFRAEASETLPFISRLRRKWRLDVNSITRGPKTSYSQSSHRRAELGRLFGPDWRSFKAGTSLGSPGRVAPGDCSPGAPTDPYVPFQAYGSSHRELATGRLPE